jgi:branched-chain amino acid transport system permease protein
LSSRLLGPRLLGPRRITAIGIGLFAIFVPPLVVPDPFIMHLLVLSAIYAAFATSLNLVMGYSGLLSLGHQAFFGLGAYASAILSALGVPLWGAVVAAGGVSTLAARGIGAVLLRMRSAFFVIATIAFAEILRVVSINWVGVTNGPMGISGVAPLRLGAIDLSDPYLAYYPAAILAALSVLVTALVVNSRIGNALVGMREAEYVARSVGIDTNRYAMWSVLVSAFIAGLAGSLYAHYVQFVSPDVFYFSIIVSLVVMVLAGGMGTLVGPVLGALVFTILPELLRASDRYRLVIYGSIIVLLVRFAPEGLWGLVLKSWRRVGFRRRSAKSVESAGEDEEPPSLDHRVEAAVQPVTEEEKAHPSGRGAG